MGRRDRAVVDMNVKNANIKIPVCRIIGPAAAPGLPGPVPAPARDDAAYSPPSPWRLVGRTSG